MATDLTFKKAIFVGYISQLLLCSNYKILVAYSFFNVFFFTYLFLAVLGILCCTSFSLVAASRGHSLVAVRELLMAVASLVADRGL